jgi:hypothetical protein
MFIGHFAVGFASKRLAPRTNVALLITAALFLDILWPIFVLGGLSAIANYELCCDSVGL